MLSRALPFPPPVPEKMSRSLLELTHALMVTADAAEVPDIRTLDMAVDDPTARFKEEIVEYLDALYEEVVRNPSRSSSSLLGNLPFCEPLSHFFESISSKNCFICLIIYFGTVRSRRVPGLLSSLLPSSHLPGRVRRRHGWRTHSCEQGTEGHPVPAQGTFSLSAHVSPLRLLSSSPPHPLRLGPTPRSSTA